MSDWWSGLVGLDPLPVQNVRTCSMTILPGSSWRCDLPGARTPKKRGARGATLAPCACSAATRALVGVKVPPTGTQVSSSARGAGERGGLAQYGMTWQKFCVPQQQPEGVSTCNASDCEPNGLSPTEVRVPKPLTLPTHLIW